MAQIFPRWLNRLPIYLAGGGGLLGLSTVFLVTYFFSPSHTDVGYMPHQPVPYSHKLHVGELGLDCRYCHASVESSPVANIPPTSVCMNCHRLVARDAASLAPLRESASSGRPMRWVRVHKLPEYVYFDHRAHVSAGIGCVSCHGRVDEMDEVRQVEPLSMSWCLECHRDPAPHLRPPEEVTNMKWMRAAGRPSETRPVEPPLDCSGCHR